MAAILTGDRLRLADSGRLPLVMSVRLPHTGRYELDLNNLVSRRPYVGHYCLTLESNKRAWKTVRRTDSVE